MNVFQDRYIKALQQVKVYLFSLLSDSVANPDSKSDKSGSEKYYSKFLEKYFANKQVSMEISHVGSPRLSINITCNESQWCTRTVTA